MEKLKQLQEEIKIDIETYKRAVKELYLEKPDEWRKGVVELNDKIITNQEILIKIIKIM